MKLLFGILVLVVGSGLVPPAAAADLITSRTVLEDASGRLTIADVAGRVSTPAGPALALGRTKSVHWLCLRVRKPADGSRVVLFIRPTYLNEVRLYEAGAGDPPSWKTRVTGNYHPFSARDRARISLGFVVDVAAPETTFYLRLQTRSPSELSVQALEPAEADRVDQQRDLVMVFFVTAMLLLLIWAILNYLLDRQRVVGLFAVHQAVYTLFGIAATGYLAPFAPLAFPRLLDWTNALLYFAIDLTTLLFVRELLKPYDPPRGMMRGLNLFLWAFPFILCARLLGYDSVALNANAALIKATWLYFVVMSFRLRAEGAPSRRLLQAFFTAVLLSNTLAWLTHRVIPGVNHVDMLIRVLIVDGLIIGALFAAILHTRARQLQREAQQAALNLMRVQQRFEIEQELKKQAELQARTDYLTGIFNRRHFVELGACELARSVRFRRPFTLLMIDIDRFKDVNDNWGHSIGDLVLRKVSQLIRQTIREQDIFGRTGGEEFAAVLVETEGDAAMRIAQRLCEAVAENVIAPPQGEPIRVTVSIGLAQLNNRRSDFDSLLKEADSAMYGAKQAGRNRVMVSDRALGDAIGRGSISGQVGSLAACRGEGAATQPSLPQ